MGQWQHLAFCDGMDTEMFINGDLAALQVCDSCPVVAECLEYALDTDAVGVWGGTTDEERLDLRRRQFLLDGEIEVIWELIPV